MLKAVLPRLKRQKAVENSHFSILLENKSNNCILIPKLKIKRITDRFSIHLSIIYIN